MDKITIFAATARVQRHLAVLIPTSMLGLGDENLLKKSRELSLTRDIVRSLRLCAPYDFVYKYLYSINGLCLVETGYDGTYGAFSRQRPPL